MLEVEEFEEEPRRGGGGARRVRSRGGGRLGRLARPVPRTRRVGAGRSARSQRAGGQHRGVRRWRAELRRVPARPARDAAHDRSRAQRPRPRSSARSTTTASSPPTSPRWRPSRTCRRPRPRRACGSSSSSTLRASARATCRRRSSCRWRTSTSTSRCCRRSSTSYLDDVAASHFRKIARALARRRGSACATPSSCCVSSTRGRRAPSRPGPSPGYVVPDVTLRRFGDEWLIISEQRGGPDAAGESPLPVDDALGQQRRRRDAALPARTRSARRRRSSATSTGARTR